MTDFFISYNKADRQWAEWIAWQVEEAGYTTVLQAWDFRPGSSFVLDMQKAITESDRTIAVLSKDYLKAEFTQSEWAAAFVKDAESKEGKLLPVRVRECKPPGLLAPLVYIDLVDLKDAKAKDALLEGVKRERVKPKTEPAFPEDVARSVPEKPNFPGLPPIWKVPSNRNPNFTGRVELLEQLGETLKSGKAAALTQAITGLGGVGKTQLALEYSYRHSNEYGIVWWVAAEEPAKLAADYAALAQPLNLPEKDARDQAAIGRAVWNRLGHSSGWLLVFDNAPDAEAVRKYIPQGQGGHVIVTSRDPNWSGVAGELSVQVMTPDEAKAFLLQRTKQSDGESAADIAKELGYLPLALEQAGAYIEATRESLSNYLEMYREHHEELLDESGPPPDYPYTVATTWEMALEKIKENSPEALELTNLCAFLAPDDIPLDVIKAGAKHLPKALAAVVTDGRKLNKIKRALRRYSLVEISGDNLTIHRLVQAVIRDLLTLDEKKRWAKAAVSIISGVFPQGGDDVRTWPECSRLLPHATASTEHAEGFNMALKETGHLLNEMGLYLMGRAEFAWSKTTYERALGMHEEFYGSDHPEFAAIINNLGMLLKVTGDLEGARKHFDRALKIWESSLGPDHPNVASCVNNLGGVLKALGDLEGARKHYERALKIWESSLGPDHPQVATCVNNIGLALWQGGDFEEACERFERALKIDKAVYGENHPDVAMDLGNLGGVLRDMGKVKEARANFERTLEIFRNYFDEDHPNVIWAKGLLESLDGLEEG